MTKPINPEITAQFNHIMGAVQTLASEGSVSFETYKELRKRLYKLMELTTGSKWVDSWEFKQ